jgi:hypothetical protein
MKQKQISNKILGPKFIGVFYDSEIVKVDSLVTIETLFSEEALCFQKKVH